ncbi:O-antigen ligase [Aureimonas sp. AU12]|uniref:O-antigen ligase family protein n=1 Tax=Aureimonas sp. AU12 TaxID=1638161 RepID=UPI0007862557|nr:O-antigen ligase family protein [Aureimonas sp. AU12]
MNHLSDEPWQNADPFRAAFGTGGLGVTRHAMELTLIAGCAFLAPFNTFRVDGFYFTVSDMFALAALLAMILNRSLPSANLGQMTVLWNAGFMLFGVMLLASSLVFGEADRGFVITGQYFYSYVILSYVLLSRSWSDTVVILKAFTLSVAVICLHGIYLIDVLAERNTVFVSGSGRLLGLVERGNEFSALIAATVPLLLWLVCSGSLKARWLCLALPIYTYAIMLTGSNTGLFALLFAIGAFIAIYGTIRQILMTGAGFALVMSAVLTWAKDFLPAIFQKRVLGAVASGDIDQAGTFVGRMKLIRDALGRIDQSMIFGIGADRYRETSTLKAPVHNTYLLIWAEGGFLSLAGFLLMLVAAVILALMAFRRPGGKLAACCALVSVALFALTLNAMPHLYARFLVMPLLLGLAPCICLARSGVVPAGVARYAVGAAPERTPRRVEI